MMMNIDGKKAMSELGKIDSSIKLLNKNDSLNRLFCLGKLFKKMKVVQLQPLLMLLIRKIVVKNWHNYLMFALAWLDLSIFIEI